MKKLLLLLLFIPLVSFGQGLRSVNLDSYKYIVISESNYKGFRKTAVKLLEKSGYNVVNIHNTARTHYVNPSDLEENPNLGLYLNINTSCGAVCDTTIALFTYNNQLVYKSSGRNVFSGGGAVKNALGTLAGYSYKFDETKVTKVVESELPDFKFNSKSEESIRDYFDDNSAEGIEGIWEYTSFDNSEYKLAIVKDDYKYYATIIEGTGLWNPGDLKATFETAAAETVLTVRWTMGDKITKIKSVGTVKNNALIEFSLNNIGKVLLYKTYPKFSKKSRVKTGEWAGNGSGVIISKSGYIITNHHVIEDADKIEVEFILNDEVQKFNAEIVQVDKTNDLAILKIFDMNFDGVEELPYNFKTRSSDVGTKVYAFGYPMALTVMGKEIKVTDGMISSKTGFDGNITTYQITAPIQGGNSGGPLFDEKGNLIGINSSGIRKDIADNVAYSIKTSYVLNLIDILPKSIELPSNTKLESLPLTEQIKEISKYVVLIKVK